MSATAPQAEGSSPSARLTSLPVVTRSQKRWCLLLGGLFAFDILDIYSFSYAAPSIAQEWGLSLGSIAFATSIAFLGMAVGGVVGGWLSDRFGRRTTIVAAALTYSLFSLLTMVAATLPLLLLVRFLTGFGIQAATSALVVYVAEMYPRTVRGRYQAGMLAIGLLGVPAGAWFTRTLVVAGPGLWRWVFVLGAAGAVLGLLALRFLPESVRWQAARGDTAGALRTVTRLEAEALAQVGHPLPGPVEEPPVAHGRLADVVRPPTRRGLLVATTAVVLVTYAFYGYNAYVPTLLVQRGYTTAQALEFASYFSLGAVPGALLAWPVIDRFERKFSVLTVALVVGGLFVVFATATGAVVAIASGFLLSMLLQTETALLYTYVPEIFPTHVRGLGAGIAYGGGRLAVFVGGLLLAPVVTAWGFAGFYVLLAILLVAGGASAAVFGPRTTGRPLVE